MEDSVPDLYKKEIIVLGCGNILFGDDGFGPAVIEFLEKQYTIPENTGVLNVGISAREILFPILLDEQRPEHVIIVDAVDAGRTPGEIFSIPVENLPLNKIDDFSMHQLPTSNLLRELHELCHVRVTIITAQIESIPDEVKPGLSKLLAESIPKACEMIMKKINEH